MQRGASTGSLFYVLSPAGSRKRSRVSQHSSPYQSKTIRPRRCSAVSQHSDKTSHLLVPTDIIVPARTQEEHKEDEPTKTYVVRYYILFIFSITSFMQYFCWNAFGPISTTAMKVFDWSEGEIALMASLDPFTYILTMLLFSWLMDTKGLRTAMVISISCMAAGTGLRCVTYNKDYVTWTMAGGQFLNGLAGPVTQAAPPLLSANWFPLKERTTATAVASLCGSLGIAASYVVGSQVVKEIKQPPQPFIGDFSNYTRYVDEVTPLLQDGVYKSSAYHCMLENIELHKVVTLYAIFLSADVSNNQPLLEKSLWTVRYSDAPNIRLDTSDDRCLRRFVDCRQGFTVSLWLKLNTNAPRKDFILGSKDFGTREVAGLLFYLKTKTNTTSTNLVLEYTLQNRTWRLAFPFASGSWSHVALAWSEQGGLLVYLNGKLSFAKRRQKITQDGAVFIPSERTGLLLANENSTRLELNELTLWSRRLDKREIFQGYNRSLHIGFHQKQNLFDKEMDSIVDEKRGDVMKLLYIEFGVCGLLFVLILLYFPEKPPTAPSQSARQEREDFFEGTKQLLKLKNFWIVCMAYGVTTGVYSGWGAVLNVNLSTFGMSQEEAGWLGFYAVIAGIVAGMLLARCADFFSGRMKLLLIGLFVGASACFLWFCLLCMRIIPYDKDSLYKSSILGGFFVSGTIPLFYELTVEQTYPISEGITMGVLTLVNNIVTGLFLVILVLPGVGTRWMNWVLFGSCAVCLPVLLVFREQYNRLNIDTMTPTSNNNNNPEILITPGNNEEGKLVPSVKRKFSNMVDNTNLLQQPEPHPV